MTPRVGEIIKKFSTQTVPSDSMNKIVAYLEAIKSSEVTWQDTDKQIIDEVHSIAFKKNTSMQFLETITEGVIGKFLRNFLKIVFGIDADERTREMESALAGAVGGACIGAVIWIIIANLEPETSFYGPVILGLLLGLVSKSIPLAILCASAGFAGVHFLGLETLIEVIYAFAIAITGAAKFGAFLGRKMNKISLPSASVSSPKNKRPSSLRGGWVLDRFTKTLWLLCSRRLSSSDL
jgi:uncharacterized membrane protein YeaQ/YmgE (transglycosylase-associated protein family)